jgi:hypothetical protein
MLAGAAPAIAAPMFDTAQPSTIATAADQAAHEHRDRGYRDGRGYRNYNGDDGYNRNSWRGRDGRYYCRRNDGTTGLLIGGAAGGLIGHSIAGRGGDRTLGTILGVAGGALLGREVDRSGSRGSCR